MGYLLGGRGAGDGDARQILYHRLAPTADQHIAPFNFATGLYTISNQFWVVSTAYLCLSCHLLLTFIEQSLASASASASAACIIRKSSIDFSSANLTCHGKTSGRNKHQDFFPPRINFKYCTNINSLPQFF